jgi:hypothetical protein
MFGAGALFRDKDIAKARWDLCELHDYWSEEQRLPVDSAPRDFSPR